MSFEAVISVPLGPTDTGLTLKAQLVDTVNANVGSEVTTGFQEIGNGLYMWYYTAFPDGFRGGVTFKDAADNVKAFVDINPEEFEVMKDLNRLVQGPVVVSAATPSVTGFTTNLTGDPDGKYEGMLAIIDSGSAAGEIAFIKTYTGATGTFVFDPPLKTAPAQNDRIYILKASLLPSIDTKHFPEAIRLIAAGIAGRTEGAGTGTIKYFGLDGTTVRLKSTVNLNNGERTTVAYSTP